MWELITGLLFFEKLVLLISISILSGFLRRGGLPDLLEADFSSVLSVSLLSITKKINTKTTTIAKVYGQYLIANTPKIKRNM